MKSLKVNRRKKVVVRTYISKKTGKKKTYRYEYYQYKVKKKGTKAKWVTRSAKNIIYRGKITKYGQAWLEEYKKGLDLSDRNDLEARILSDERHKRTVKASTMIARMKETKIERYIYNMGGDVRDLSEDLNISEEDILNDKNWVFNGDVGHFIFNGTTYEFHFKYKEHALDWEIIE